MHNLPYRNSLPLLVQRFLARFLCITQRALLLVNDGRCSSLISKDRNAIGRPWHLISSIACGRACINIKLINLPQSVSIRIAERSRVIASSRQLTASLSL